VIYCEAKLGPNPRRGGGTDNRMEEESTNSSMPAKTSRWLGPGLASLFFEQVPQARLHRM
jgi:hypothetical protein